MKKLEGILPAIVTPIDQTGTFEVRAYEQLLAHVYAAGVHGIYVCGQTGEGLQQSSAQRKLVAEASVRLSPPAKIVMIHVGALSTAEAVALAEHAAAIGADAISALPPIGNYSFAEIKAYYRAIAAASALPLLIYYFPAFAPAINSIHQLLELYEIPNIHGLKFTDADLFKMSELKRQGATIFYGTDEMLTAGLIMGADGGIGSFYNVMPKLFVQLYELTRQNEWLQARAVQATINEVIAIGLRYPVHASVKAMLQELGVNCGGCIPPRRNLSTEELIDLKQCFAQTQFLQS